MNIGITRKNEKYRIEKVWNDDSGEEVYELIKSYQVRGSHPVIYGFFRNKRRIEYGEWQDSEQTIASGDYDWAIRTADHYGIKWSDVK